MSDNGCTEQPVRDCGGSVVIRALTLTPFSNHQISRIWSCRLMLCVTQVAKLISCQSPDVSAVKSSELLLKSFFLSLHTLSITDDRKDESFLRNLSGSGLFFPSFFLKADTTGQLEADSLSQPRFENEKNKIKKDAELGETG